MISRFYCNITPQECKRIPHRNLGENGQILPGNCYNLGIMALKAMAHQSWPTGEKRKWSKTFYEPFDEVDTAAPGLRFTLHLPVTAVFPPGHWGELLKMALDLAQAGALVPLDDAEKKIIEKIAKKSDPIFS